MKIRTIIGEPLETHKLYSSKKREKNVSLAFYKRWDSRQSMQNYTPMSSVVGNASVSALRVLFPLTPSLLFWMNLSPLLMYRSEPRS